MIFSVFLFLEDFLTNLELDLVKHFPALGEACAKLRFVNLEPLVPIFLLPLVPL